MDDYTIWINFYSELANKLLKYNNDRTTLINIVKKVMTESNMKMIEFADCDGTADIDPFSIFALFNREINDAKRITILSNFKSELKLSNDTPTYFGGIPVVSNLKPVFFSKKSTTIKEDIERLWKLFSLAIAYSDNLGNNEVDFSNEYNQAIKQPQVKWNLTMGLYWIRPYTFINLDSRNRQYIIENQQYADAFLDGNVQLLNDIPDATGYLRICSRGKKWFADNTTEFDNFPSFSNDACAGF